MGSNGLTTRGVDSRQRQAIFIFKNVQTFSNVPPSYYSISTGVLSSAVKRPKPEVERSHPPTADFKKEWGYTPNPSTFTCHRGEDRAKFTFTIPQLKSKKIPSFEIDCLISSETRVIIGFAVHCSEAQFSLLVCCTCVIDNVGDGKTVFNAVSTNSRATRFAMLYFTPI
jgi:hypothetical protein